MFIKNVKQESCHWPATNTTPVQSIMIIRNSTPNMTLCSSAFHVALCFVYDMPGDHFLKYLAETLKTNRYSCIFHNMVCFICGKKERYCQFQPIGNVRQAETSRNSCQTGLQQVFYFGIETFGVRVAAKPGHFTHIHFCNALETFQMSFTYLLKIIIELKRSLEIVEQHDEVTIRHP
uniref:Uncharacterized protein n=1 Tax=Glossina pallidipes TaxID=7398 RepID=A0A1A9ZNR9_GLOPL